jgi:hypothetical protein
MSVPSEGVHMPDFAKSEVLLGQIDFYDEQAESWVTNHQMANRCFALQTILSTGLNLFGLIDAITEQFNKASELQNHGFDEESARAISNLYRLWYRPCDKLLRAIEVLEAEGYRIERAEEFRAACRNARVPAFEFDRINSALNQFSRGRGRPMGEALSAIRNRTVE